MEFVEGGQVNDRAYMEKNQIDVNEVRWELVLGQRDCRVCLGLLASAWALRP